MLQSRTVALAETDSGAALIALLMGSNAKALPDPINPMTISKWRNIFMVGTSLKKG
jgi:hypothetical protein